MSRGDGGTRIAAAALLRAAARGEPCGGPFLVVQAAGGAPRRVEVGGELTVGRGAGAALRLDDAGVSRLHARFRVGPDGEATVEDLGSKNGVRWNGRRVAAAPCRLRPGDRVEVGTTTLVYADPLAEVADEARLAPGGPGAVSPPGGPEAGPPPAARADAPPPPAQALQAGGAAGWRAPPGALLAAGAALLALAGALLALG